MAVEYLPYVKLIENLIRPLAEAAESPNQAEELLRELGYAPPSEVLAFNELSATIAAVTDIIAAVRTAVDTEDRVKLLQQLAEVLIETGRALQGINDFTTKIQRNFAGSPLLTVTDILPEIPRKLLDYIVVRFLEDYHPLLYASLLVGGVVDVDDIEDAPTPFHVPYRKRIVNWEAFPTMLSDPLGSLKTNVLDGDELLYERLLWLLYQLGLGLGLQPSFEGPHPALLATLNQGTDLSALEASDELPVLYFPFLADPYIGLGTDIYPLAEPATGKYTGLGLAVRLGAQLEFPLGEAFKLVIKVSATVSEGLGFRMERDGTVSFVSSIFSASPQELLDSVQFGLKFSILPSAVGPTGKMLALGAPGGVRFEIGSGSLAFGLEKLDTFKLFVETQLNDGLLVLGGEGADGFLAALLPKEGITSTFALGVGVSNLAGLYFTGSSGLLIRIPVHLSIGPIELQYIGIRVGLEQNKVPVSITAGFSGVLGPLSVAVEDMGVTITFRSAPNRDGNLGPLDTDFSFQPPSGAGLAVNAAVVKGGGYIAYDRDREEYSGAMELTFSDFLSLKAIGIITTRMPDGSKGFSLLIIITAEFGTGLQLGFGFSLLGVGGLLGLNRTVVLQALVDGVRNGAVNRIMFPQNVVANAPRIISDLRTIFPPKQDVFLIGPMAKIGWGTPPLISLSLGIVIEIPGNVVILGVLRAALPREEAPVLVLQVSFIGVIEFAKKRLYLFAGLFESRVLFMTLEGEMGVLAAFGDDATFVLSVGGFHNRFKPPPLPFPVPRRLALTVLNESNAKLRAECYFAVTSNTVQFGAQVDAFFGFNSCSVTGGLGFDALFQFSPFYFIIEMSAHFSIKVFGTGVFGIRIRMSLEGPTPWRAQGTGSISFFFFDVKVRFDRTWGEERSTTLPPIQVMPILMAELRKDANWQALLPTNNNLLVSLRKLPEGDTALVLHPVGTLRVSQRAVPLDLNITKVGNQAASDAKRLSLAVSGGVLSKLANVNESFAPAQYRNLDDATKLSKPAFEKEHGGIDLAMQGQQLASGAVVKRQLRYDVVTIDTNYRRFASRAKPIGAGLFGHFARGGSVSRSVLSAHEKSRLVPFVDVVATPGESYTVASQADNRAHDAGATFTSEGMAQDYLAAVVAADPSLAGTLHVIPDYERAA